jgi:RNA polymerase sigma factor (sigma-70 family)
MGRLVTAPDPVALLPLVGGLARKYRSTPLGRDEAFGFGSLALVQAARRFDPDAGEFPTYAWHCVQGAMQHACRHYGQSRSRSVIEEPSGIDLDCGATHDHYFGTERILDRLAGLDRTEQTIAVLLAAGYRNDEIAAAWGVTKSRISQRLRTVKAHLAVAS